MHRWRACAGGAARGSDSRTAVRLQRGGQAEGEVTVQTSERAVVCVSVFVAP